jgi:hypothetical protein
MLSNFYLALGTTLLLGYTVVSFNGWELGGATTLQAGADYRTNPSYRTGHSWYWGYRGGK